MKDVLVSNISISIDTDSADMSENKEEKTAQVLRILANNLVRGRHPEKLYDVNGNVVGKVEYK